MARKKGKYSHIIDALPKFEGADDAHKARINALRAEIYDEKREQTGMPPTGAELVADFLETKAAKEDLEATIRLLELELEALTAMIWDQFEAEGVYRVDLQDGTGLRLQEEPYPQVHDRSKFYDYCVANQLTEKLTMPYQTLKALTVQLLDAEQEAPDGVTCFKKPKLVRTN